MNKQLLAFSALMLQSNFLFCQQVNTGSPGSPESTEQRHWAALMQDPQVNFFEVEAAFDSYWKGREIEKGKGYKQFQRWAWFMEPRVYPEGKRFAPDALWNELQRHRKKSANLNMPDGVWTYFGNTEVPGNGGGAGRVNTVRAQPGFPDELFACAPAGGLWKSSDAGNSWSILNTDNLSSIGSSDLVIDPNNSDIIYLATGDGDAGDTYSVGVLKSVDGGQTWMNTGLSWSQSQTVRISRIIIHPDNSSILLAASSNGIWKTTNGGINWVNIQNGNFKDISFKPDEPEVVYATTGSHNYYRSSNTGDSFLNITSGLPTGGVNRMAIGVTEANPEYIYLLASSSSNSGFYGLYRSTDAGLSFSLMSNAPNILGWDVFGGDSGGQGWYDLAIAVSPQDPNIVFTGGVNVWRSLNGGIDWECVGHWYGAEGRPYVHADIHHLNFIADTETLLVACDGGVFRSDDLGNSFEDLSANLEIGQMYRLGLSAGNENLVITGWQDNGSNLKNGISWDRVIGGDGMECIISHSNQNTMFGTIYFGNIYKSNDGGANFNQIVSSDGTEINEGGAWVTPYVMDPVNASRLWVGKSKVYTTADGGASWAGLGSMPGNSINCLAVAPSDPNYIYATKGSSFFRSTDGMNFTESGGLPNLYRTSIAIDPTNPLRIWMTMSGFSAGNKVFASEDGGLTWSNYSDGLPNAPANCIVYQNGSNDGLYVGTDIGVYYRESGFAAWQSYMDGLPNVPVSELEIHYQSGTIAAATYGRGLWRAPLFSLPELDAAIVEIANPRGTLCDTWVTPSVSISNFGTSDINSITLQYEVNGNIYSDTWNGLISTGTVEWIELSGFDAGTGSFAIYISIIEVNNTSGDDNPFNDAKQETYYVTGGENNVSLVLNTDCWGEETSWDVRDEFGNTIFWGGGYADLSSVSIPLCLPDGCLQFSIYDSYGDGMAGSIFGCETDGYYEILSEEGYPIISMINANFGYSESQELCLPFIVNYGCMDPLADNYHPEAMVDDGTCDYTCEEVAWSLTTDCWGYETGWQITDGYGNIMYSVPTNTYGNQTTYNQVVCLPDGCYTLEIFDTYGDGMAGTQFGCANDGSYNLSYTDGTLLATMNEANFGNYIAHAFCISYPDCPGDFNEDGLVNSGDLLILLSEFGCLQNCSVDLDGDDFISTGDVLSFLGAYGNNCP
jgi:hypothetical protein